MEEVYRDLAILALMPPAGWLALRIMDYAIAKYAYHTGYLDENPTFFTAPEICREECKKLEKQYGIKH